MTGVGYGPTTAVLFGYAWSAADETSVRPMGVLAGMGCCVHRVGVTDEAAPAPFMLVTAALVWVVCGPLYRSVTHMFAARSVCSLF